MDLVCKLDNQLRVLELSITLKLPVDEIEQYKAIFSCVAISSVQVHLQSYHVDVGVITLK